MIRDEWLEDILAVIDCGSFSKAAEKRCLTQPAFSRRIRALESQLGTELFDRTRKPVTLHHNVLEQESKMRELLIELRELGKALTRETHDRTPVIRLASQHAISTAIAPGLIARLSGIVDSSIRLLSANRDECFRMLITGDADFVILYKLPGESLQHDGGVVEQRLITTDRLIPVIAETSPTAKVVSKGDSPLPLIAYPADVFFGKVVNQHISPHLPQQLRLHVVAETALTPAALQFAVAGLGVAWLPASLVAADISAARLATLEGQLPSTEIEMMALRLKGSSSRVSDQIWEAIV